MTERPRASRLLLALVPLLAVALFDPRLDGRAQEEQKKPEAEEGPAEERPLKPGYCGAETCASCHEEQHTLLGASVHSSLLTNAASIGCEACHGPGAAHADEFDDPTKIRHPRKLSRNDSEALCMSCHGEEKWVPEWYRSDWRRDGLSCVDCHTVHQSRAILDQPRLAAPWPAPGAAAAPAPAPAKSKGKSKEKPAPEPPADQPLFEMKTVGSSRCLSCHTVACATFRESKHLALTARETERPACESCHGPGSLHAESGGAKPLILNPEKAGKREAEAVCLSCHSSTPYVSGWQTSEHGRNAVSCLDCHATVAHEGARSGGGHPEPRAAAAAPDLKAASSPHEHEWSHSPQMESCGACHANVVAEFRFPNHHRVPEGAMSCTDCHNPHRTGSMINDRQLKEDTCFNCHAEKRGPFVYPHDADRVEGCVVCHEPHGSINRRLLTHHEVRMQCLQCHSNLFSFHDQSPGSEFRNCINCHTEIHGSQLDRKYFR